MLPLYINNVNHTTLLNFSKFAKIVIKFYPGLPVTIAILFSCPATLFALVGKQIGFIPWGESSVVSNFLERILRSEYLMLTKRGNGWQVRVSVEKTIRTQQVTLQMVDVELHPHRIAPIF